MQLYILFGLPGAGKTFVGKIFQDHYGFYLYDGDDDLPVDMKQAIKNLSPITENMRDNFSNNIIQKTKQLIKTHNKIVIAQTFIKERHRKQFLKNFPQSEFILVKSDNTIRENRLIQRKEYPLDLKYARQMKTNFDEPQINYLTINNDIDGEENIKQQLQIILKKSK